MTQEISLIINISPSVQSINKTTAITSSLRKVLTPLTLDSNILEKVLMDATMPLYKRNFSMPPAKDQTGQTN
jgi:hypothetical protein